MTIHCVGCGVEVIDDITLPTSLIPVCMSCSCRQEVREYVYALRQPQAIVVSSHLMEPPPEPTYVQR